MFICNISVFNKYGKLKLDELLAPLFMDWHEFVVMLVSDRVPGISQTRLVPFLQTDKANVTKILQKMEMKDLVHREVDESDQRNKVVWLTEAGRTRIPQLYDIMDRWEAMCFRGLTEEEILAFRTITNTITRNLVEDWKIEGGTQ